MITYFSKGVWMSIKSSSLFLALILTISAGLTFNGYVLAGTSSDNPLVKTFEAHGGLDKWDGKGTMIYTLDGFPLSPQVAKPNKSTVDLKNRYNLIEGEGFTVGFNGLQAWAVPGPDAVGLPTRFFNLGSFYFIGMPFVFGDPGTVITDAGTATFKGKTYRVANVGYKRGTGYTSSDDYVLLIDPVTDRLALIHHSVTEVPDVDRVTWVFNEWQEVDGLLVPALLTFYPGWNPEDPGEGSVTVIRNVSFSDDSPDPSIYNPPDEAVIDDSPEIH